MRERKNGHIINVSSIGVQTNTPRFSAYIASKAALDAFTRCIASEIVDDNVHTTVIFMPLVRTPMIAPTRMYRRFPTITPEEAAGIREQLGFGGEPEAPVPLRDVELRAPRVEPPGSLAHLFRSEPYERASHALGKAYRDVVRGFRGDFANPPDLVAVPGDEPEVERVLAWCSEEGIAAIPYGGGTSVVAGVEPRTSAPHEAVVTIDLRHLDRLLDVDLTSRAARIQAGASGP